MKEIGRVIGRIIRMLVDKGVISQVEGMWILEPLKDIKGEEE